MELAIRVDSSLQIGTGHVYRCLTLAKKLRQGNHHVVFICRALVGNLIDLITSEGFEVLTLNVEEDVKLETPKKPLSKSYSTWLGVSYEREIEQSKQLIEDHLTQIESTTLDWIITDHYAIDAYWHKTMRPSCRYIMHIDDLANRSVDCDILLDQNFYIDMDDRYATLAHSSNTHNVISDKDIDTTGSVLLLGPSFALLNDSFRDFHLALEAFELRLQRGQVLFFFGGIDKHNETLKALKGIAPLLNHYRLTGLVVLGQHNPHQHELSQYCSEFSQLSIAVQIDNMSARLAESFLYVGAVGATVWERCCLGLPAITSTVAENQEPLADSMSHIGAHICLGRQDITKSAEYAKAFTMLVNQKKLLFAQSENVLNMVDAKGCARVVEAIEEIDQRQSLTH
jgi:UDP-2,4-diacetamido-2,4,6-trideoxy-beta-L-altropyranose hydrolase